MGRGRAKAKQTKVARELKYHTPNTDLDALARELGTARPSRDSDEGMDDHRDPYEQYEDSQPQRAAN